MLEAGTAGCQSKAPGPEIEICKSRPDDLLRLPAEVNRRSDYEDSAENCYSSKAFVQQGLTEQASNHRFKIQEHAGSRSWDPLQSQFQARYALAVARSPCPAAAPHTAGEK